VAERRWGFGGGAKKELGCLSGALGMEKKNIYKKKEKEIACMLVDREWRKGSFNQSLHTHSMINDLV